MKIAIVGAQGTGKTTLAKDLIKTEYFVGYKLLPEVARLAKEVGYNLDKEVSIEAEFWMLNKQLELEMQDNFIADRCLIDILVYCRLLFPDKPWVESLVQNIIDSSMGYDLIIYLPAGEFEIENDGVRETDKEFQKKLDDEYKKILRGFSYKTITGSPEERVKKVLELIKKYE